MGEIKKNSIFTTMVGKEVKAYKSGPESWHGLLLAVQPDYILLFNKKDGFIYHKTKHIKSIIVDSKTKKKTTRTPINEANLTLGSFQEILQKLLYQKVKINRGGPGSKEGILVAVADDYIAVETKKEGTVYFIMEHIKSVTTKVCVHEDVRELIKKSDHEEKDSESELVVEVKKREDKKDEKKKRKKEREKEWEADRYPFIQANNLDELLNQMKYSAIVINHGPETIEGIVCDCSDHMVTVVYQDEVLRMNKLHIKMIRQKIKSSENENNSSNEESIVTVKKKRQDRKKRR